ncbi:hypothetical protein QTP70_002038 [Hemibagrus guttatus]|uniref:Uncharacterized protein n=1 Tax=Hemibagrus guttatus TaxID=175788 RepID=A0AAE0V1L9_9TELE|nr:hypothetical protein QTP70_002038 [Hemibagrus guttatus]
MSRDQRDKSKTAVSAQILKATLDSMERQIQSASGRLKKSPHSLSVARVKKKDEMQTVDSLNPCYMICL